MHNGPRDRIVINAGKRPLIKHVSASPAGEDEAPTGDCVRVAAE